MKNRYVKLYSMEQVLCSEACPIMLMEENLLKNTDSSAVVAQVKMKSLSDKEIIEAAIVITQYDSAGRLVGNALEHHYMDLNVLRGDVFGEKTAITSIHNYTRCITVEIKEIIFKDKTIWECPDSIKWEYFPKQKLLEEVFQNTAVVTQYKLDVCSSAKGILMKQGNIWQCSCGEHNKMDELFCHKCGCSFDIQESVKFDALTNASDRRVAEENEIRERRKIEEEKRRRKLIIIAILAVCVVAIAIISIQSFSKLKHYYINKTSSDVAYFGEYEQDNNTANGKEDIEWIVLEKEEDKILVVSKYILDCRPYNHVNSATTWDNCELREWLNNDFLREAFSSEERKRIISSEVCADNNPEYNTFPGNGTEDKVFMLSVSDVEAIAENSEIMKCEPTEYALAQANGDKAAGCWWLRTPGAEHSYAAVIGIDGKTILGGFSVQRSNVGVRPAMWIKKK